MHARHPSAPSNQFRFPHTQSQRPSTPTCTTLEICPPLQWSGMDPPLPRKRVLRDRSKRARSAPRFLLVPCPIDGRIGGPSRPFAKRSDHKVRGRRFLSFRMRRISPSFGDCDRFSRCHYRRRQRLPRQRSGMLREAIPQTQRISEQQWQQPGTHMVG